MSLYGMLDSSMRIMGMARWNSLLREMIRMGSSPSRSSLSRNVVCAVSR